MVKVEFTHTDKFNKINVNYFEMIVFLGRTYGKNACFMFNVVVKFGTFKGFFFRVR